MASWTPAGCWRLDSQVLILQFSATSASELLLYENIFLIKNENTVSWYYDIYVDLKI